MRIYTTREVAEKTGYAKRTVNLWCQKNGVEQHGRQYILTDRHVSALATRREENLRAG